MDKLVEKFPHKKVLYLNWYEAAIAHLLLFKYLKEKYSNNVYFLVSEQGILLKAVSLAVLKTTEQEIDRFFTAKIEQLELSGSSQFYDNVIDDIKEQTDKLKDRQDCPLINLVYSEKLKHSCLAMKKYGYLKPYENWESHERERRGFCYLIVRPEHRWKEIANTVMALVKKREQGNQKAEVEPAWNIEIPYEKFVWLFLRPQFATLKKELEIKEKKSESLLILTVKNQQSEFIQLEQDLKTLQIVYIDQKPDIACSNIVVLSSLQIEKITELIYHEFGLPNLVKELRRRTGKYMVVGEGGWQNSVGVKHGLELREDITPVDPSSLSSFYRIGNHHEIVTYEGMKLVVVKVGSPLGRNIEKMLSVRLPCLPKYYYWYLKDGQIALLRRYETTKFKSVLGEQSLFDQFFLVNSLILILKKLHLRDIFVGRKFPDNVYVDGRRIIIEPGESGSASEEMAKFKLVLREWIKGLQACEMKEQLEKINEPQEISNRLNEYLQLNS